MGVFRRRFSSSSYSSSPSPPSSPSSPSVGDPDPDNFTMLNSFQDGKYLIVELKYPDCSNFEGKKILVYHNVTLVDLINQKKIDPHFCDDTEYKSPIARFVPTDVGWEMALRFCQAMNTTT